MALKHTNNENYSLSIAVWLADDEYDHAPVVGPYISATGLLKSLRMIVLAQRIRAVKAQSPDDDVIDISRYVSSRLGTAIHSSIEGTWTSRYKTALLRLGHPQAIVDRVKVNPEPENINEGDITVYMEQRAYRKVSTYTIGGMFDFIGDGTLEDFKSMGVYGYMKGDKDEEQLLQGSIYRWLNPKLVTSDHMLIQQIFTDWSKLDASIKKKRGYPQKRILSKKLTLMTLKETDNWVIQRIRLIESHTDTPESELPLCTQKELWQPDSVFKYYKNPAKTGRSTANFNTYAEAHGRFLKDNQIGIIKEFPGLVKRCGYCDAFDICTQKDVYIKEGILQMPQGESMKHTDPFGNEIKRATFTLDSEANYGDCPEEGPISYGIGDDVIKKIKKEAKP